MGEIPSYLTVHLLELAFKKYPSLCSVNSIVLNTAIYPATTASSLFKKS